MSQRYVLAPTAADDLVEIWSYFERNGGLELADRVETVVLEKLAFLARSPGAGHWRRDLTSESVKFFVVYSYLIVYRPDTEPLQVVAILHGRRNLESLLKRRI